jgi:hypothetical protein
LTGRVVTSPSQLTCRSHTVACGWTAVNRDLIAASRPPRPGLVLIPATRVACCLLLACSASAQPRSHPARTARA